MTARAFADSRARLVKWAWEHGRRLPDEIARLTFRQAVAMLGVQPTATPMTPRQAHEWTWSKRGKCRGCGAVNKLVPGFCSTCKADVRPYTDDEIRQMWEQRQGRAAARDSLTGRRG